MQNLINKITLGDCMNFIRDMPDKSIDLIIADPPYGIGESKDKSSRWKNRIDQEMGGQL